MKVINHPFTLKTLCAIGSIVMANATDRAYAQVDWATQSEPVRFEPGDVLYENPLSCPDDIKDWVIESKIKGHPAITFPHGRMQMESDCHFLLWCPKDFPDNIAVSWEFQPRNDKGLAMFWTAVTGANGKDLFDPSLQKRDGDYSDYRKGDINALHVAYFRRNAAPPGRGPMGEINFQICSLRKTTINDNGPVMKRAADPIPCARDAIEPYRMQVIKHGRHFRFSINDFIIIDWIDTGDEDTVLRGGKIGFRQMRGLIGDYATLTVRRVTKVTASE